VPLEHEPRRARVLLGIQRREGRIATDWRGITTRNRRDGHSMPEFIRHPIKTPADLIGKKVGVQAVNEPIWDALLRPCYERIGEFVRRHGIRFLLHSDGRM
jgi:hypothetical protein